MKVTTSTIQQLLITDVPNLDPIRVMIENFEPGQGMITITCYGESWSNYWGAMGGGSTIEVFFTRASANYLAGKLGNGIKSEMYDSNFAETACRKQVITDRRARDLNHKEARELWERIDWNEFYDEPGPSAELFNDIFGDEWWNQLPEKPNPKWTYLLRIVETIKEALAAPHNQQQGE